MMKLVIFLAALGLAVAMPQGAPRATLKTAEIQNVRSEFDNPGDGNYFWAYENSDGTQAQEKGSQKPAPPGSEFPTLQVAEGFYKYNAPEGTPVHITYVADDRGFVASGDAIPTAPPIPEAILKSLNINLQNAANQRNQRSSNKRF